MCSGSFFLGLRLGIDLFPGGLFQFFRRDVDDVAEKKGSPVALYIYNKVEKDAEITIECNPDDVTDEFTKGLTTLPVNRVSMGIQTFSDERLRFLNRRHTAAQAVEAVARLRKVGLRNISIDLMYGFPGETLDDWQRDIEAAIALNVEHLSAYCLIRHRGRWPRRTSRRATAPSMWRVRASRHGRGHSRSTTG